MEGIDCESRRIEETAIAIIDSGLTARAIAKHTNITYDILAKYKQGKLYLCPEDAEKLKSYLDKIVIPQ